jgi:hypothetical protein
MLSAKYKRGHEIPLSPKVIYDLTSSDEAYSLR